MIKSILTGGIGLLFSIYSFSQTGLSNNDAVETESSPDSHLFVNANLPSKGVVSGFHSDGRFRYHGAVKNSKLHGTWKSWYANNTIHEEGTLKKGLPDGTWKVWYPDGKIRYIRTYSSDKYIRIKQEWRRPHPKMPNYGLTNLYTKDRNQAISLTRSRYSFKEKSGINLHTPVFNNCLHHGLFMNYSENGWVKDSGYYKNGLKEGVWMESVPGNTSYETGYYKNGIRSGTWKMYTSGKKLLKIVHYKNGKADWSKDYE